MRRVLITGGAGFIGAYLARALVAQGDYPVLLDNFSELMYPAELKKERVKALVPRQPLVKADIRDARAMAEVMRKWKPQAVIHLAALAGVPLSLEHPLVYSDVNVTGTVQVLEAARKAGVKQFIFASSSSVYGDRASKKPAREDTKIDCPLNVYGASKAAGEQICFAYHKLWKMRCICLRFFTCYGPWGRPDMALFLFGERMVRGEPVIMHGRKTTRDFTYVEDIVQGVVRALDYPAGYAIFNLAAGDTVPLPRYINAIARALGVEPQIIERPLPEGEMPANTADISRARGELGYQPRYSVEEGVARWAEWFRAWYVPRYVSTAAAACRAKQG
jgi:UDP-glucuronate 4-epimerase